MGKTRIVKVISDQIMMLTYLGRWIPIAALVGIMGGSASALLLVSLELATNIRERHVWLILLLAPAGWVVGLLYKHFGSSVEPGNNLILEQTHDPTAVIPFRMTPLILLGTFVTHLFGGSAGREGTAIQTGASLADQLSGPLRLTPHDRRILLMAGISAGFASVFGTPLAGAMFGLEVLAIGKVNYDAIAPCIMAAFAGELATKAWGVHHTIYRVTEVPAMSIGGVIYSMIAGVAFGLAGMGLAKLTHLVSKTAQKYIPSTPLRPLAGGLLITLAVFGIGTSRTLRYLGLGIPTIVASFDSKLPPYEFIFKSLFTALTLGTGFKGGEVTPLFFIGSTLGNALSHRLPLPSSLLAGMGFVAVFAGAANTPIASTLMAVELFGAEAGAFAGIACVISYLFSGHAGIYKSQRVGRSKHLNNSAEEGLSLALVARMRDIPDDIDLEDLNDFGYIGEHDMKHRGVLRLYFSASEMRKADSWWKRIAPQTLGAYLLQQAKDHGIEQALLHRVIGGYLKGQDLAMETGEIPPARLPQCLELVGDEQDLQAFVEDNKDYLQKVRVVFLHGREAEIEAAIEREELEEALEMEHVEGIPLSSKEDRALSD